MRISTKTVIMYLLLVLLTGWNARAQFVMQVSGAGNIEPRIFKNNFTSGYYITGRTNNSTYITQVTASGSLGTTHDITFPGDPAIIKDMVVDWTDGTLAGIAEGINNTSSTSYTYIFRYDFASASFVWLTSYPVRAVQLVNIHQTSAATYVVTGKEKFASVFIGEVNSASGGVGSFQEIGFNCDFFSAYDGVDIYGAGAYYVTPTVQNPATFRYGATNGINAWANNYVTGVGASRIYPVAPIVDGSRVVVLSSGDATGSFNTYQSGPTDAWLHATDLAGNILWTKNITIPGGYNNLHARQIINTATGYYLLIDNYLPGTPGYENFFFIIKTDKTGNLVWANRYGLSSLNKVISGVEDNGDLYITALSRSYPPFNLNNTLFLKLDPFGMGCTGCNFIVPWTANIATVGNVQQVLPFTPASTNVSPSNFVAPIAIDTPLSVMHCCGGGSGGGGGGGLLACTTLTGSLNNGVMAYYPFGYGSLLDLSGNGLNLTNNTFAAPTFDRNNRPCAYRFQLTDYLELTAAQTTAFDNMTLGAFSISLWYQPLGTRAVGDYELLVGRGNPLAVQPASINCPDTWEEWSVGLYDCRKVMVGADSRSHWETPTTSLTCPQLLTAISNNWHHMVVTHDGSSNYTLYVDNVPYINNHGPCGPGTTNVMQLVLGKDYNGDLDDVIIYNRQLSSTEVAALYSWPASSCCDGVTSVSKPTGTVTVTNDNNSIKLYPNPANGQVSVLTDGTIVKEVSVYNATGILVNTYSFNKINPSFDITELSSGIYVIKVKTAKGESVEKLIKN